MQAYDDGPTKGHGSTEQLADRDVRALTEYMTTLSLGGQIYSVTTESGSEYRVDGRDKVCDCPDFTYRDDVQKCKHLRRVEFATGERVIPQWVDREEVDPQLGEHVDSGPTFGHRTVARPDGGVRATEQSPNDCDSDDDGDGGFTYHVEPAKQGGEKYVRCEDCGRELLCKLGGKDDLPHRDGCSNGGTDR